MTSPRQSNMSIIENEEKKEDIFRFRDLPLVLQAKIIGLSGSPKELAHSSLLVFKKLHEHILAKDNYNWAALQKGKKILRELQLQTHLPHHPTIETLQRSLYGLIKLGTGELNLEDALKMEPLELTLVAGSDTQFKALVFNFKNFIYWIEKLPHYAKHIIERVLCDDNHLKRVLTSDPDILIQIGRYLTNDQKNTLVKKALDFDDEIFKSIIGLNNISPEESLTSAKEQYPEHAYQIQEKYTLIETSIIKKMLSELRVCKGWLTKPFSQAVLKNTYYDDVSIDDRNFQVSYLNYIQALGPDVKALFQSDLSDAEFLSHPTLNLLLAENNVLRAQLYNLSLPVHIGDFALNYPVEIYHEAYQRLEVNRISQEADISDSTVQYSKPRL